MDTDISVEDLISLAEKQWSKRKILDASKGLRDLQLRWDNKRQLTHTIHDGQISTTVSVNLADSDSVSLFISSSGYDPDKVDSTSHSSMYFSMNKDQLKEVGKFIYFSSLEPGESDGLNNE